MKSHQRAEESLAAVIGRIAGIIGSEDFPPAERAALRRIDQGRRTPLAFHKFAVQHLGDYGESQEADWKSIVAGIALMSPQAHSPARSFGQALAQAGYTELRLERLLSARGPTRRTLLLRTARHLAPKGMAFNWAEAADFLLTGSERREEVNKRIARDFYRALEAQ